MITDDQHRKIGSLLGFPTCCVEAWIVDRRNGFNAAYFRGVMFGQKRTQLEQREIRQQISDLLGRDFPMIDRYPRYVPCPECRSKYPNAGLLKVC